MRIVSPYGEPQHWLKGNLHTHTDLSDGRASLDEIVAMYRLDGYDFLAVTDHDRFSTGQAAGAGEMLLLPAQECHVGGTSSNFSYHFVGLGDTGDIPRFDTGQEIVDEINSRGGTAILCHPRWSFMPYELFDEITGYAAFEVYNGACEKMVGRGFSNDYWDRYMTLYKRPLWAVAVDDTHRPQRDFATGWTFVNAEKSPSAIIDAVRRGDCYATCGPRIEAIAVGERRIELYTSSAKAVKFISTEGEALLTVEGEHVKHAAYEPAGDEPYIRAEVHGHDGRIAWTNPFFIEP